LCNQNKTPLVFLQNITGYMVGREYEREGITKDGAKMIMVQAGSEVPKFTIMTNGSYGAGNYGMCGRAFDSRFLFSWPNSEISVMGGEQAAKTLATIKTTQLEREGKTLSEEERAKIYSDVTDDYEHQSSAYYTSSLIWDDGIIDPADTRNALGMAIATAMNAPIEDPRYGVLRV
jgi:3-methylcrotonyl-CoA carboxylase beta subunit